MDHLTPGAAPTFPDGFRFDRVEVDVASLRLRVDGVDSGVEALQVRTLICLAEAWPGLVSKDQLIERVWAGRFVSDAAVHKTISLLRRQLREVEGRDLILTRHRLGYQLAQAPRSRQPDAAATPVVDAATETRPSRSPAGSIAPTRVPFAAAGLAALVLLVVAAMALWPSADPRVAEALAHIEPPPAAAAAKAPALDALDDAALLALVESAYPGNPDLAFAAAETARGRASVRGQPAALARAHRQLGRIFRQRGDLTSAGGHFAAALPLFERGGERAEQAGVLLNLGTVLDESGGELADVLALYARAGELWRALDDSASLARLHNNRAGLMIRHGRFAEAESDIEQMRAEAERGAEPELQARADLLRGDLRGRLGEPGAELDYQRAYDRASSEGLSLVAAIAAQRLGRIDELAGAHARQREWLQLARRHLQAAGAIGQLPVIDYGLGASFEREGLRVEAREAYLRALQATPAEPPAPLRIDLLVNIARLDRLQGDFDASREGLQRADSEARIAGHSAGLASVLVNRGFLELATEGSAVAALAAAQEAEALLSEGTDWTLRRNVLHLAALALVASERPLEADSRLRQLREQAEQRGDRDGRASADQVEAISQLLRGRFDQGYAALLRSLGGADAAFSSATASSPHAEAVQVQAGTAQTDRPSDSMAGGVGDLLPWLLLPLGVLIGRAWPRRAGAGDSG